MMIIAQNQSLVKQTNLLSLLQVVGGSVFLALLSQISMPLYFTPVPLSLQTLGMMLVGVTLGSKKGLLSVLLYLMEGFCGLPVFACGSFGIGVLLRSSGGYFLGFALQAYFAGWFVERQSSFSSVKTACALFASCILQMLPGVFWLASFVGIPSAFLLGFIPFIFGELLKVGAVTAYIKSRLQ